MSKYQLQPLDVNVYRGLYENTQIKIDVTVDVDEAKYCLNYTTGPSIYSVDFAFQRCKNGLYIVVESGISNLVPIFFEERFPVLCDMVTDYLLIRYGLKEGEDLTKAVLLPDELTIYIDQNLAAYENLIA